MDQQSQGVNFFAQNVILLSIVALAIFAYLVMLIRKRWKKGFLHDAEAGPKDGK
jgi:hypothetical protein